MISGLKKFIGVAQTSDLEPEFLKLLGNVQVVDGVYDHSNQQTVLFKYGEHIISPLLLLKEFMKHLMKNFWYDILMRSVLHITVYLWRLTCLIAVAVWKPQEYFE